MLEQSHSTPDLGQASIPAVNQYLQLAETLNLPVEAILLNLNLSPEQLSDNSGHITGLKFQQLISELLRLSQDPLFGLHTAQFVQPGSYSVLGYISMNCETLGEAISKIQPFEKLVGDMGTSTFEKYGDDFKISWRCGFSDPLVRRHMVDNCLASWLTFARYLCDQPSNPSNPSKVWLTRQTPDRLEQQEYQKLFACPVLFNQASDSILFSEAMLALPLNKGNKQLLSTLEAHAKELIDNLSQEQDVVSQVEYLIKLNLETGHFTQQAIAKLIGIGSKTLQRRLTAENTGFQSVLDRVRLRQVNQLLLNTALNLTQIGIKLGFEEPRSFYRWFKKLTGQTPGEYRKSL